METRYYSTLAFFKKLCVALILFSLAAANHAVTPPPTPQSEAAPEPTTPSVTQAAQHHGEEVKRGNYGYSGPYGYSPYCYDCQPTLIPSVVITKTVCVTCAVPTTYYTTTTTWCPPSQVYGYGYTPPPTYGYGYDYQTLKTTTVYAPTAAAGPPVYCSTLTAKGKDLPTDGQGPCGTIRIVSQGVTLRGVQVVGVMVAGWTLVLLSKLLR